VEELAWSCIKHLASIMKTQIFHLANISSQSVHAKEIHIFQPANILNSSLARVRIYGGLKLTYQDAASEKSAVTATVVE
jgi:hypothetical protein